MLSVDYLMMPMRFAVKFHVDWWLGEGKLTILDLFRVSNDAGRLCKDSQQIYRKSRG